MPHLIRRIVSKTWKPVLLLALLTPPASMSVMFFSTPTFATNFLDVLNQPALAVPESDRAWPLYREALSALPPLEESGHQRISYFGRRPVDSEWASTRIFLLEHAGLLEQLRVASLRPGLGWIGRFPGQHTDADLAYLKFFDPYYPDPHPTLNYTTPHRSVANGHIERAPGLDVVAECLLADLWLAAEQNDAERIASNYRALLHVANHSDENSQLWSYMLASNWRTQAHESLSEIITTTAAGTNAELLQRLLESAESIPSPTPDPQRFAVAENDLIQRLFTARGLPTWTGAWLTDSESLEGFHDVSSPSLGARLKIAFEAPVTYVTGPGRSAFIQAISQRNKRLQTALDQPAHRPSLGGGDIIVGCGNTPSGHARRLRDYLAQIESGWPIQIVTTRRAEEASARDALHLTLVLHLYHADHGRWPNQLWELVPAYLVTLPPDPINGGILGYRIINDQPLIYSVGSDRDDDGGRIPTYTAPDHYGQPPHIKHTPKPAPHLARYWHEDQPADGDWVLYPWPADPPADPDANPYGGGY